MTKTYKDRQHVKGKQDKRHKILDARIVSYNQTIADSKDTSGKYRKPGSLKKD